MESLSAVPSLFGGDDGIIYTKYPSQHERNIILERFESEILRRFHIGKYDKNKRKRKKKEKGKVASSKGSKKKDVAVAQGEERQSISVGGSHLKDNGDKNITDKQKNLDVTKAAAKSRIIIGVNQVTRAMESSMLMMRSNQTSSIKDNRTSSSTDIPKKKKQKCQDNESSCSKKKEERSKDDVSSMSQPNTVAVVPPAVRTPQLLILARDVRPGHMLAHLISMSYHHPNNNIPILLLPGRSSIDLGTLFGIRTCSALLFVSPACRSPTSNVEDNKLLNICHKDIDYFIEYAKSKIPK